MELYFSTMSSREQEAVFLCISEGEEKVCGGQVTIGVIAALHCEVDMLLAARCLEACPVPDQGPDCRETGGPEGNVSVEGLGGVLGHVLQHLVNLHAVFICGSPCETSIGDFLGLPGLGHQVAPLLLLPDVSHHAPLPFVGGNLGH